MFSSGLGLAFFFFFFFLVFFVFFFSFSTNKLRSRTGAVVFSPSAKQLPPVVNWLWALDSSVNYIPLPSVSGWQYCWPYSCPAPGWRWYTWRSRWPWHCGVERKREIIRSDKADALQRGYTLGIPRLRDVFLKCARNCHNLFFNALVNLRAAVHKLRDSQRRSCFSQQENFHFLFPNPRGLQWGQGARPAN